MIRLPRPKLAPVEPTPDEARNGWDAETLGRYLAERGGVSGVYVPDPDRRAPIRVVGGWDGYDPHDAVS